MELAFLSARPGPPSTPPAPPIALRLGEPAWIEVAGATHVGHFRAANEDRFVLRAADSGSEVLLGVFDGMGGHGGGDVAAHLAAEGLGRWFRQPVPSPEAERHQALVQAFLTVDEAIHRRGRLEPGQDGMGTTAVVALLEPNRALHLYAGDSRLYLYRDGRCLLQTLDHTIVQLLVSHGKIPAEAAAFHPMRHQLISCLGGKSDPGSATIEPAWEPEGQDQPAFLHPQPGDVVLLCSDGLCGEVPDQALEDLVRAHGQDPVALVQACIQAALEAGGRDNVTVLAARYLGNQAPAPAQDEIP